MKPSSRNGCKFPKTPGGKRRGAGRTPEEFKDKCGKLANSERFFAWAQGILNGTIEAESQDFRLKLWKEMRNTKYGMPAQVVAQESEDGNLIPYSLVVKVEDSSKSSEGKS